MPFKKGCIPWNKGKHYFPKFGYKKGNIPFCKLHPEVCKANSGSFKKGHISYSKLHPECMQRGKNHHNWKGGKTIHQDGYIQIRKPKHPFCNPNGYIFEHRLVMEKHLGRYLKREEVVHHINGIVDDNHLKNLIFFSNESEHRKFHHIKKYN